MQDNRKTKVIDLKIASEIKLINTDEGLYYQVNIYNSVDAVLKIARLSVLKCIKKACITHNDECYEAILYPDENYDVCYVNNAIEVAMTEDGTGNYLRTQHGMIKEMLDETPNPEKLYNDAVIFLYGIDNRSALDN